MLFYVWVYMDGISNISLNRDSWQALVNVLMNLQVDWVRTG